MKGRTISENKNTTIIQTVGIERRNKKIAAASDTTFFLF